MAGNLEATGEALTGGILGRTVEPAAGEAADGHSRETNCLNCGAPLEGPYCHECGQHAHVHRTLAALFHDFAHGVLHVEGKIWRTLPMLAWQPGELTRRYIDGQRARFVSPIALFLFCVFLTFASVSLFHSFGTNSIKTKQGLDAELAADQHKLASLQGQRTAAVKSGRFTTAIDAQITSVRQDATAIQGVRNGDLQKAGVVHGDSSFGWVRAILAKVKANPELFVYKLKTSAYKYSWALIPISVPFVWLLFPLSRRFKLYDHTVFVTYSLCFMMLLLVAATVIDQASDSVAELAVFVPPLHMYRQLRGAYGVGRWGAIWRTVALLVFAFVAVGLFASLLVVIGALD